MLTNKLANEIKHQQQQADTTIIGHWAIKANKRLVDCKDKAVVHKLGSF